MATRTSFLFTVPFTTFQTYTLLYLTSEIPLVLHLALPHHQPLTWPAMSNFLEHIPGYMKENGMLEAPKRSTKQRLFGTMPALLHVTIGGMRRRYSILGKYSGGKRRVQKCCKVDLVSKKLWNDNKSSSVVNINGYCTTPVRHDFIRSFVNAIVLFTHFLKVEFFVFHTDSGTDRQRCG